MDDRARILLLTGAPGIGKTTIAAGVASALGGRRLGGFLTREVRAADGQRTGFALTTFDGQRATLASVELPSAHRVGRYGVDLAALDAVVDRALDPGAGAELHVVDEIGRMECLSPRFCAAVRTLLDAGRPVIATVALRGEGLIAEVKARPDAVLGEVTRANRDRMVGRILGWLARRGLGPARSP
jgi:nucleoside-triphosphatase